MNIKTNDMSSLFNDSIRCSEDLGPEFTGNIKNLEELQSRLKDGRFHLAVLGQFKRGKSTFLNALLGDTLLPSSVLPLTAIPTFIQGSVSMEARVLGMDGSVKDRITAKSSSELGDFLKRFVTEEFNPHNCLGVSQVEVFHPATIFHKGVVLIDTPGIGSTFRHNTEATLAFLPQCDAAVFLISADPPISELEVDFLKKVRSRVPRLFFLLNKVDYLSEEEKRDSVQFFKKILRDQIGIDGDVPIFAISARQGLHAKKSEDVKGWVQSGMAEVEEHLIDFLVIEKNNTLRKALSRKAGDVLADVLMQVHLAIRSLQMPLAELEKCQQIFEEKIKEAEQQRIIVKDLLKGERNRTMEFLESQAEQLRQKARGCLTEIMEQSLADRADMNTVRKAIADAIPPFFEVELSDTARVFDMRVQEVLQPHQKRADELIESIRKTAATLFDIPYHAPESAEAFEMKRQPYWVTRKWEDFFRPIPEGAFDRLIPSQIRRSKIKKRVSEELETLVIQNVENLRWSTLQNLDKAFRMFGADLDERLQHTIIATHGAIQAACTRRKEQSEVVSEELTRFKSAADRLEDLMGKFMAKSSIID